MSGVNKVIILGVLGRDPEIRYSPDGKASAMFSVATSESWKDKNTGEKQEKTEWHNIVAFGKIAEIIGEYCAKGSKVYVEGKLNTRKWKDKEGTQRYTTQIVVGDIQFLSRKSEKSAEGSAEKHNPEQDKHPVPDFDDDIPF